jgi:tetratricopeptide (TPR) repeat protein
MERLLEIDPTLADPHNGLAYAYSWRDDNDRAIAEIEKYLILLPGVANGYDSAMEIYIHAGRFDKVREVCQKLERSDPANLLSTYLGYVDLFEGSGEEARGVFHRVLGNDRTAEWDLRVNDGCSYVHEGRFKEALVEFRKMVDFAQNTKNTKREVRARFFVGKMLLAQGSYSAALNEFSTAENLSVPIYEQSFNPIPIMAEYLIGVTLITKGDFVEAQNLATKFHSLVHKNRYSFLFENYYQLLIAELQLARGDGRSARASLEKVSMLVQTHFPRCSALIAATDALNGEAETAIRVYKSSMNKIHTRNNYSGGDYFYYFLGRSKVYYNVAKLYEQKGDKTQALEYYSKALAQWKNADKDLPELIDAKTRVGKLTGKAAL